MKKFYALSLNAMTGFCLALALSCQPSFCDTFTQTNLVSDVPGLANTTDANLKNPWGLAYAPSSPFWVSNQGSGTSTLYDGAGNTIPLVVTIPGGTPPLTGPTGQVFNGTSSFVMPNGNPARFIFDSLNGSITAWNGGGTAVQVASTPGAIFTGLALAGVGSSNYLYAADSTGKVRVFDSSFKPVTLSGHFSDPSAPAGFVPFNIQLIGSQLYVTYAALSQTGTGLPGGYVDAFDTSGNFIRRVATGGALNAPWGITLAPASFGAFSNDLLVGNFGNGEINAFNPNTGTFVGTLDGANGKPIVNDFLWALDFRTGGANVNTDALYFTAGINNQADGLFGDITATPEPQSILFVLLGCAALTLYGRRRRTLN